MLCADQQSRARQEAVTVRRCEMFRQVIFVQTKRNLTVCISRRTNSLLNLKLMGATSKLYEKFAVRLNPSGILFSRHASSSKIQNHPFCVVNVCFEFAPIEV